jgi:hypothetical protein
VFFAHGVFYRTNGGSQGIAFYLNFGQVLFYGGIYTAGNQFLHLFATAYQGHAGVVDLGNQVAAMITTIKLNFFHDFSS